MVTRSGVGATRVTLSDRGTKDSKVEDTGASTTDVNPCISLIRPHSTSPTARGLRENLKLVGISGGLAVLFGVTAGIVLSRPRLRGAASNIIQLLNVGTAVPTLALLALSMSFLGIGRLPAVFALWVASLLPIVRNTYVGLTEVPEPLLESATGMGMTPFEILVRVELPKSLWVIFAGVRTAITINVGTAPLAFLIGGGGLGQLIFTGISLDQPDMMLAGAVATAVMAIVIDFAIASFARLMVSKGILPTA